MLSPGAAKSNGQIALALLDVVRNQIGEQTLDSAQEFTGLWERADVLPYFRVRAVVRAQPGYKMRVGQKAHVKHQVRVGRNAIAVAEADYRDGERAPVRIFEARSIEMTELVNIELAGVDDHVSQLPDRLHQRALVV